PLLQFIEKLCTTHPGRTIAVLIPELVKRHWWQHLLHTRRARQLRTALLQHGGSRLVVINVPWYCEEPRPGEAMEGEETPRNTAAERPARTGAGQR
ncbi:MAG: APC family permease, partial [Alphaproteobacteria bacterium]|nr:APC family permease [Alphaproteobacteria bacterium]